MKLTRSKFEIINSKLLHASISRLERRELSKQKTCASFTNKRRMFIYPVRIGPAQRSRNISSFQWCVKGFKRSQCSYVKSFQYSRLLHKTGCVKCHTHNMPLLVANLLHSSRCVRCAHAHTQNTIVGCCSLAEMCCVCITWSLARVTSTSTSLRARPATLWMSDKDSGTGMQTNWSSTHANEWITVTYTVTINIPRLANAKTINGNFFRALKHFFENFPKELLPIFGNSETLLKSASYSDDGNKCKGSNLGC